jgi:hypothetical protein
MQWMERTSTQADPLTKRARGVFEHVTQVQTWAYLE